MITNKITQILEMNCDIYHAFWVNIETICDAFSVFYYGLTHVSANKDNDRKVHVYKLFTHNLTSVDSLTQRPRAKC